MFDAHLRSTGSKRLPTFPLLAASFLFGSAALSAVEFSNYRGMAFGAKISDVSNQAGVKPSDARILHQRPAMIQEMDWRPSAVDPRIKNPVQDPVKTGLLYFFNGELFRIVITYDRYKVEGLTADDMIEAISATYGSATKPDEQIAYHSIYGEVAPVLARWQDAQYAYTLVRTGDGSSFAMILCSKRLDALAQASIGESARLEAQEGLERETEKQKKRDVEDGLATERARAVNKPNFRP